MNWVIAFFSCFMFQWHNIYLANIVFVIGFIYSWMKNGRLHVFKNGMIYFLFYFVWVACSIILYLPYKTVDKRNLIQFVYNLQYIFWIVHVKTEKKKLRYAFYVCSKLLAISIVGAWVLNYAGTHNIIYLLVGNRMWGEKLFGGWPNGTVLPLLYGLYMEMKHTSRFRPIIILDIFILYFALLLTTSRTGLLAGFFIITYFIVFRDGFSLKTVAGVCVLICSLIFFIDVIMNNKDAGLVGRMLMTNDRMNIYLSSLEYIKRRPISGLGGNTFDYAYETFGSTIAPWNWGHTHNTIFELLIRYGSVGLITFAMYIIYLYKRIRDKDDRFAFLLFWIISLMQIFLKDFVFLIMIWTLIPNYCEEKNFVKTKRILRFGGRTCC